MKATSAYRPVIYACFFRFWTARRICLAAFAGEATNSRLTTSGNGRSGFSMAVSTPPGWTQSRR